jgi:large subunit ribosomal protein L21
MTDDTKETGTTEEPVVEEPTADEAVAEATPAVEPAAAAPVTAPVAAAATAAADAKAAKDAARKAKRSRPAPEPAPPPVKYAVVETGGKQYRVKVGDRITVERLDVEAGSDVTIDRVLLIGGDGSTRIGTPVVDGAAVTATVNDHGRGEKIVVFKFKAKKRYRRRTGHRQAQTYLTITGISG